MCMGKHIAPEVVASGLRIKREASLRHTVGFKFQHGKWQGEERWKKRVLDDSINLLNQTNSELSPSHL